ncbi:MAG: hypothetical protein JNM17_18825 [Archangium sp.]|nr:hypothetical protein [Archangium sp.]
MRTLFFAMAVVTGLISGCGGPPCSTSTCDGCCEMGTNTCRSGRDTSKCGRDGAFCVQCPGSQMCVASSPATTSGGSCQ